ncbi:conserved hypothetical protein [gamma proteobacterium HdN1]|nr:conserved hypothetical protein [gamma proteobacterium HdN1]
MYTPDYRQRQMRRFRRILRRYFGRISTSMLNEVLSACEWMELEGGELLFGQGDPGDAAYFLIAGRLRAIRFHPDGSFRPLGEIRPGEIVGEEAVLAEDRRGAMVRATRDSVVVRLPTRELRAWFLQYPQLLLKTAQLIIARSRQNTGMRYVEHVCNLALLPLSVGVDVASFREAFAQALEQLGRVLIISARDVDQALGEQGIAQVGRGDTARYRQLSAWLDSLENRFDHVVYLADPADDAWTQRCLRQADRIVLLGDAQQSPRVAAFEPSLMAQAAARGQTEVLLAIQHPASTVMPENTRSWLADRPWVSEVVHVRQACSRHLQRLARIATGKAVGLVLGSGGARGLAAVGILQALEEAGVPVDRVGGTSIGAIMAATVALDLPAGDAVELARQSFSQNPTHMKDLSPLPILAIYRGKRLNGLLQTTFPEQLHIEDLWINFFCITSNMASNGEVVHTRGPVWKALRASASLPGIFPVVRLEDGLHVDGAFLNALPVDVMAARGVHTILAADFSSMPSPALRQATGEVEVAEEPSRLRDYLREHLLGQQGHTYPVPNLLSGLIQSSLMASSQRSLRARAEADVLFAPDLQRFELLGWHCFDDLVAIGYKHAQKVLADQSRGGSEPSVMRSLRALSSTRSPSPFQEDR